MNHGSLLAELKALELELHQVEVRSNTDRLQALLHPDFREFGRSGDEFTLADVLAEFAGNALDYQVWAQDFTLEVVAKDITLLTYRSAHVGPDQSLLRHTNRASIWQSTSAGWKMRFHQGTPTREFVRHAS